MVEAKAFDFEVEKEADIIDAKFKNISVQLMVNPKGNKFVAIKTVAKFKDGTTGKRAQVWVPIDSVEDLIKAINSLRKK